MAIARDIEGNKEKLQKNSEKIQKISEKLRKKAEEKHEKDAAKLAGIEGLPVATIDGDTPVLPAVPSGSDTRGVLEQKTLEHAMAHPQAPFLGIRPPDPTLTPDQYLMDVVRQGPPPGLPPDLLVVFEAKRQAAAIALLPYHLRRKAPETDDGNTGSQHEAWLARTAAKVPQREESSPEGPGNTE